MRIWDFILKEKFASMIITIKFLFISTIHMSYYFSEFLHVSKAPYIIYAINGGILRSYT